MQVGSFVVSLLQSGFSNLASYLAAHVLLCLLPAFFVAGALAALVPKEAITRYLGDDAPKWVSYPAAALGGFVLAVCSCTVMPIFAGIYRKGAGLGPAIAFLFVGPAINILALSYTGVAIGMDIAIARVILSLVFGVGIGLIMAVAYARDEAKRLGDGSEFSSTAKVPSRVWLILLLLGALLMAGTLQVDLLTNSYGEFTLPIQGVDGLQGALDRLVPYDAGMQEEGLSVQGLFLIGLLGLIGISAWRGLEDVYEGYTPWTWATLGLIGLTLIVASLRWVSGAAGLTIQLTGRTVAIALAGAGIVTLAHRSYEAEAIQEWLWETWRFAKQIFPLLLVGVFAVGLIRELIRPEWIQAAAGSNSVLGNVAGVVFGVFMYFPTLVEVPIAKMFLGLGMHSGPLLAYLIADPGLSLQSIMITSKIVGKAKAWTYVGLVALFSTLAGLIYGAWVDGVSLWLLGALLVALVGALLAALHRISRRLVAAAVATDPNRS